MLRKCPTSWENLPLQIYELQFLKKLIFPRALSKLKNWINISIFSYLKLFSVSIINGSCEVVQTF